MGRPRIKEQESEREPKRFPSERQAQNVFTARCRKEREKRETLIISRDEIAVSSSNNVLINDHAMGGLKLLIALSGLSFSLPLSLVRSFIHSFTKHVHLPSYVPHSLSR